MLNQQQQHQQNQLVQEEYKALIKQRQEENKRNQLTYKNMSIWSEANYKPATTIESNSHHFDAAKFTEKNCRERWYELHRDKLQMSEIKQKNMENKRIKSIQSMTDPFALYDFDQRLEKMQRQQQQSGQTTKKICKQLEQNYKGYNIFKDSIRKIDDMDQYNRLKAHMKEKLHLASQQKIEGKPMLYTPYYDRLEEFEVNEQQLTFEKMQQIMSRPIQMELMERELKVLDLNQRAYQSKIKKENQKKIRHQKIKNQEQFEIEEDWDQYESD